MNASILNQRNGNLKGLYLDLSWINKVGIFESSLSHVREDNPWQ